MEKINYDELMQKIIEQNIVQKKIPTLLLHSCCAPCSSACLTRLTDYFNVTVFYYNPNIEPYEEYLKRKDEQIHLLKELPFKNKISFLDCDYEIEEYKKIIGGLEEEPEGGKRCSNCYNLRLSKTAKIAQEKNYEYFGTTLTVSPYKNAKLLNEIGSSLSKEYDVKFLYSDFKKQDGYKKSIELSKKYGLYRQDYCGCIYSKKERENYIKQKNSN